MDILPGNGKIDVMWSLRCYPSLAVDETSQCDFQSLNLLLGQRIYSVLRALTPYCLYDVMAIRLIIADHLIRMEL